MYIVHVHLHACELVNVVVYVWKTEMLYVQCTVHTCMYACMYTLYGMQGIRCIRTLHIHVIISVWGRVPLVAYLTFVGGLCDGETSLTLSLSLSSL